MRLSRDTIALLKRALAEDIGGGDATSRAVVPARARARAVILCKSPGVACGLPVAERVFSLVSPSLSWRPAFSDGDRVRKGDRVAEISGPARALLAGERVALNLLSRLSGIATATRTLVEAAGPSGPVVLDTRKTTPGLRELERYAVRAGGGRNHRFDLSAMILIKDNHLVCAGGVAEAVRRAKAGNPGRLAVEVEVKDLAELAEALAEGADRILLDNMTPRQVRAAARLARGRVPLEASGGMTPRKVAALRGSGVAFVSSGALTHSAPAVDFSLEVEGCR